MIITVKVSLVQGRYYGGAWSASIELDETSTLEDLHYAIQAAVHFDNDHLYCYFAARTDRSQSREYFDDENERVFTTTLKDLFPLPEKRCLFYLFDWGDEWIFRISLSRKRPHEPVKRRKYPRIESRTGVTPKQYPSGDDY